MHPNAVCASWWAGDTLHCTERGLSDSYLTCLSVPLVAFARCVAFPWHQTIGQGTSIKITLRLSRRASSRISRAWKNCKCSCDDTFDGSMSSWVPLSLENTNIWRASPFATYRCTLLYCYLRACMLISNKCLSECHRARSANECRSQ